MKATTSPLANLVLMRMFAKITTSDAACKPDSRWYTTPKTCHGLFKGDKMKIKDTQAPGDIRTGGGSAISRQSGGGLLSIFSKELQGKQLEVDSYDRDIDQLRQDIDKAGELLEKEPTLANFKQFRTLLSQLAKRVSNEAYRLEKVGGTPLNPRYYEVITVIDKEADKLYDLIIREQKDRMAITASVIGIKGLVVDLVT
jgi:uncharacterized protein